MNTRTSKLNSEFKRLIAEVLTKKVKDPRITEMFTVIDVDCDKELSSAKVFVSVFSTDPQKAATTFAAIKENEPIVRREISRVMHIRKVPEFRFVLDESMQYGQKIDELLYELSKKNGDNN